MNKSKYSANEINKAVADFCNGTAAEIVCERAQISIATLYNWKKKYAGLDEQSVQTVMQLQEDCKALRHQVDELLYDKQILQLIINKLDVCRF